MSFALWIALICLAGFFLLCAREFIAVWLPSVVALSMISTGKKDTAERLLKKVIATPTLLCRTAVRDSRFRLAWLLMKKGRYDEAAEQLRACLLDKMEPGIEANIRQRYAEALEGAGQTEEAKAERETISGLLSGTQTDVNILLSRARELRKEQRYEDEYGMLLSALPKLPASITEIRARTMVQIALAAFNSGKPAETIRWGEEALALKSTDLIRETAFSVCGLGYGNLGRLDEAEEKIKAAVEIGRKNSNDDATARHLTQLAGILRRRGKIAEAMGICQEARGLSVSERRSVYAAESECLQVEGRFEEALQMLGVMRQAQSFPTPSFQKRMSAAISGSEAELQCELDLPDKALLLNDEALEGLKNDDKLTLIHHAVRVRILAMLGRKTEGLSLLQSVKERLPAYSHAQGVQLDCLLALGRACFVRQDFEQASSYFERYMAQAPDPVSRPTGLYFLGMCRLECGDKAGAEEFFRQATAPDIDTLYARLATKQLSLLAVDGM